MLDLSNLRDYKDALTYDLEHPRMGPEGPFYLEFARQAKGPVLELGCGTGRLTIPFAREGIDMVGLDAAPQMLAQARAKSQGLPIRWVEADVRTFELETEFNLIFSTGEVFHHLLTLADQEAMLTQARKHLAPGGKLVIDILYLPPSAIVDQPEEVIWQADSHINQDGNPVTVSGTEHFDAVKQIWRTDIYRRWVGTDGQPTTRHAQLTYRYIFPREMEALLHYNDLKILAHYGDLSRGPVTGERSCHYYVCARQ